MTCAEERTAPYSGRVERVDQPPRTMPYRPSEAIARMYREATGMSASCSGVEWPKIVTFGPIGMTA